MCSVCHDRHWQNCCQKGVLFYRAANETVETFGLAKGQRPRSKTGLNRIGVMLRQN
jgi:hypothetical protein